MLSVIFLDGYLVARHSEFDIIGTLTSRSVVETGPPSSMAPQPVTMPVSPVKVLAEDDTNTHTHTYTDYAHFFFIRIYFLESEFRGEARTTRANNIFGESSYRRTFFRQANRFHPIVEVNLPVDLYEGYVIVVVYGGVAAVPNDLRHPKVLGRRLRRGISVVLHYAHAHQGLLESDRQLC